jgi:hypothetical protein
MLGPNEHVTSEQVICTGSVARMRKTRNVYTIFVEKRFVKLAIRRPRMRWEDNIDMYRREMFEYRRWIITVHCCVGSLRVLLPVLFFCESMAG